MGVVAAVLRRGVIREDLVVGHMVKVHSVASWAANNWWVDAKIAKQISDRDGKQALIEERVAMPGDLHPGNMQLQIAISNRAVGFVPQYLYLTTARGCVNADDLLVAAPSAYRNHKRHEVDVESAL